MPKNSFTQLTIYIYIIMQPILKACIDIHYKLFSDKNT